MNFSIESIPKDTASSMRAKNIWNEACPVTLEKLRLLKLTHYDFAGNLCAGEMIVHEKIAEITISIFKELLTLKFPIEKIRLIDHYDGNDELSMADNNSSCFNYRMIAGSEIVSMHACGLAIDINPVQNPYIIIPEIRHPEEHEVRRGDLLQLHEIAASPAAPRNDAPCAQVKIYPSAGKTYLNRANQRPGMLEPVVSIFTQHGLIWGGSWNSPIDYHHFQVDRARLSEF